MPFLLVNNIKASIKPRIKTGEWPGPSSAPPCTPVILATLFLFKYSSDFPSQGLCTYCSLCLDHSPRNICIESLTSLSSSFLFFNVRSSESLLRPCFLSSTFQSSYCTRVARQKSTPHLI